MRVNTNGKRNVSLDFDAPKKFKLADEQGRDVPYIRTGKSTFRLSGNVPEFVELNEIIEQPKPQTIVKPMQLQAKQMAIVNTDDVLVLNQVAQQLEIEQNLLAETQKQSQLTQEYLDVQQGNINNAIADVNALETNNAERLTAVESGLVNTSAVIDNTRALLYASDMEIAQSIDEHKAANNPHNITKKTIGLDKVDNTSDMDKPVSKAVASALEEKANKTELQDVKDELLKYQEKNEKINNALSQYTGGIGGNELPSGGTEGQVLIKKSDQEGDVAWGNAAGIERHNILDGRDENDAHPISAITDLQDVLDGKQAVGDYATNTALTQGLETKQDVITDLETIRENAQDGKGASDTISTYGDIVTHNINEFQPAGDYATNTDLTQGLATKQDIISDLDTIRENASLVSTKQDIISDLETIRSNAQDGKDIIPQVNVNTQRIEDLTTAKFPNVVIVGTPHIEGGQVSNYSDTSYLQFPFVDISRGQPFDIYFSFTTAQDVTTQQNILDAYFGIALAIQNGKGIMALSSNGTSWDIGTSVGTNTLLPNTTYYVKYSWTGTEYSAALSTDDQTYVPDMNLASTLSPHKTTIFIGGSPNIFGAGSAHPFKGTINFNKSKVVVNGITVWEGMADVGLASRANVSLNNLDEVGEGRFNTKQDTLVSGTNIKTINGESIVGAGNITIKSAPDLDNVTINRNTDDKLQAIGVIDNNGGNALKTWTGTKAQYDAITTKDNNTLYNITDDNTAVAYQAYTKSEVDSLIEAIYPVGSLYLTTNATCPLANLFGTWTLVSQDRVLQGAGSRGTVGTTINESLPNITGTTQSFYTYGSGGGGAFKNTELRGGGVLTGSTANTGCTMATFDASLSSSTYKNNAPVQQNAYLINVFRRVA